MWEEELLSNAIGRVVAEQQSRASVRVRGPWGGKQGKQTQLGPEQRHCHSCRNKEGQPCLAILKGGSCEKGLASFILGIKGEMGPSLPTSSPNLLLAGTHVLPMWKLWVSVWLHPICRSHLLRDSPIHTFPIVVEWVSERHLHLCP